MALVSGKPSFWTKWIETKKTQGCYSKKVRTFLLVETNWKSFQSIGVNFFLGLRMGRRFPIFWLFGHMFSHFGWLQTTRRWTRCCEMLPSPWPQRPRTYRCNHWWRRPTDQPTNQPTNQPTKQTNKQTNKETKNSWTVVRFLLDVETVLNIAIVNHQPFSLFGQFFGVFVLRSLRWTHFFKVQRFLTKIIEKKLATPTPKETSCARA